MDSALVQAARQIYQFHLQYRPDVLEQPPRGVVIHRRTLRGDLIFSDFPVLLPQETFIPIQQLEQVA
ncbi:MAG: hypothetical protein SNJ85_11210 [Cyanobacteriota bacterium]